MSMALNKTQRPIAFSCSWPAYEGGLPPKVCLKYVSFTKSERCLSSQARIVSSSLVFRKTAVLPVTFQLRTPSVRAVES